MVIFRDMSNTWKQVFGWVVCLLFLGAGAMQAQDVSFYKSASEVTMRENLELRVNIAGLADPGYPSFPDIEGFVKNGTGRSFSSVNGQATITYTQSYRPYKEGSFMVPEYVVRAGRKDYVSDAFEVTVSPDQSNAGIGQADPMDEIDRLLDEFYDQYPSRRRGGLRGYLELEYPEQEFYENQQVPGVLYAYVHSPDEIEVEVEEGEVVDMIDRLRRNGLWVEEAKLLPLTDSLVEIGGIEYHKYPIAKMALFPTMRRGRRRIRIPEMVLRVSVKAVRQGNFGRYHRDRGLNLYNKTQYLDLKEVPDNSSLLPGRLSISAVLPNSTLQTGESFEMEFRLAGTPRLSLLKDPNFTFPNSFRVEPPGVSLQTDFSDSALLMSRTFYYGMAATQPGEYEIGPFKYPYFNTQTGAIDTVRVEAFNLKVEGDPVSKNFTHSTTIKNFYEDAIQAASTDKGPAPRRASPWLFIALFLGTVAGAAFLFRQPAAKAEAEEEKPKDKLDF